MPFIGFIEVQQILLHIFTLPMREDTCICWFLFEFLVPLDELVLGDEPGLAFGKGELLVFLLVSGNDVAGGCWRWS